MRTVCPNIARAEIAGFTLIELAIVLVVIGFIVGAVLVGQDMIRAAQVRAQITQLERFNTAAATFQGKYAYLPGDIPPTAVAQFGFTAAPASTRAGTQGLGDGNGLIEGYSFPNNIANGAYQTGEPLFFWDDLSGNAGLIDGYINFYPNPWNGVTYTPTCLTVTCIVLYYPPAKIGPNNYVMVYSQNGANYFTVTETTVLQNNGNIISTPNLTVWQAQMIDQKTDDGLPQTGRVTAQYLNRNVGGGAVWAAGGGVAGASPGAVASPSSTTCFDNGGNASNPMAYSVQQNSGANVNCALSFKMQAGD